VWAFTTGYKIVAICEQTGWLFSTKPFRCHLYMRCGAVITI